MLKVQNFLSQDYEDRETVRLLSQLFRRKRGRYFSLPSKGSSVILIISGGLDSVCLWYLLMKKYQLAVYPIHFIRTTQTNEGQVASLKYYSQIFARDFPKLFRPVRYLKQPKTDFFAKRDSHSFLESDLVYLLNNLTIKGNREAFGVRLLQDPFRLSRYVFAAYRYALELRDSGVNDLFTIFIGVIPSDIKLARESSLAYIQSVNLSFSILIGDFRWQFIAPINAADNFVWSKEQLVTFASRNHLDLSHTWSCGQSRFFRQCGQCFQCQQRKDVFSSLGLPDSTLYLNYLKYRNFFRWLKHKVSFLKPNKAPPMSRAMLKHSLKRRKIQIAPNVSWERFLGRIYVLDRNQGLIEMIEADFVPIWELLQKPQTLKSLSKLGLKISPPALEEFLLHNLQEQILVFSS